MNWVSKIYDVLSQSFPHFLKCLAFANDNLLTNVKSFNNNNFSSKEGVSSRGWHWSKRGETCLELEREKGRERDL